MLVGACIMVAPDEDEVIVGENSVADKGVGGIVKSNGEVTKEGSGPSGVGVVWDGEGDWCWGEGRLVV